MDFRQYDWDDTALIAAYEKGLKARMANKGKEKGDSPRKENKRRKWKVDDYCRALYSDDKLYYEAKIISLNGDFCTVEFLGYSDTEDVDLNELKESLGKKSRKKQIKAAADNAFERNSSMDGSETAGDISEETVTSCSLYRKKKAHVNQPANMTYDTTYETNFHQPYAAAPPAPYYGPPPHIPTNLPFMPAPMPPAPAMPQCPNLANNPALSSMLTAWYMAGYYTGMHSAQKENRSCQRCCSHSNMCCH